MVRDLGPLETFQAYIDVNGAGRNTISDSRSEIWGAHLNTSLLQEDIVSRGD